MGQTSQGLGSNRDWKNLWPSDDHSHNPVILEREITHTTPYHESHHVKADFGDYQKDYYVTEGSSRVGLVVDKCGEILIVSQYRLLIDALSIEIPGGAIDKCETPQHAAVRECVEETGVLCSEVTPLLSLHAGLDTLYNPVKLFYSRNIASENQFGSVHPHEIQSTHWIPLQECVDMIFQGKIVDNFSVSALLAYDRITSQFQH